MNLIKNSLIIQWGDNDLFGLGKKKLNYLYLCSKIIRVL